MSSPGGGRRQTGRPWWKAVGERVPRQFGSRRTGKGNGRPTTDKTSDDVTALTVGDLQFVLNDGTWQLADDADCTLDQSAVKRMVSTLCEMQTEWSITTPEADSAYGLDAPDVTAVLTFTDGTQLTVRFGDLVPEAADDTDTGSTTTTSLCYLASDGAPGIVYEVKAAHKDAFAVTKESLHDDTATAETAADTDVVAQYPVGGENDYADSLPD